jgi:hypothetical protein
LGAFTGDSSEIKEVAEEEEEEGTVISSGSMITLMVSQAAQIVASGVFSNVHTSQAQPMSAS